MRPQTEMELVGYYGYLRSMAEDGEFGKKIFTVVRGVQVRSQARGVGAMRTGIFLGKI